MNVRIKNFMPIALCPKFHLHTGGYPRMPLSNTKKNAVIAKEFITLIIVTLYSMCLSRL